MLLRALAVLAAVAVPLLASRAAWVGPVLALPGGWLLLVALSVACAVPVVVAAGEQRTQALAGAALAGLATAASPEVPALLEITGEAPAVHDLREAPLHPGAARSARFLAVRGYLREAWVVDEYRVAPGERPDQNRAAEAVFVPLLGTEAEVVAISELGLLVVARVEPGRGDASGVVTLRGRVEPAPPAILDALVTPQSSAGPPGSTPVASAAAERPEAIVLDTLAVPTRAQALTRAALAAAAAALALLCLLFALPRRREHGRS